MLSLKKPYTPLKADSIASITKKALESFGIPSKIWGAHSTRGAGVSLMKKLGLKADEVCEIGRWKNVGAFTSHYQRLEAQGVLENSLGKVLAGKGGHKTSHGQRAEHEGSRTPPRAADGGGSDP